MIRRIPKVVPVFLFSMLFLLGPVFSAPAQAAQQANPVELQKRTYEVLQAYRAARNQLIQNKSKTKSALLYKNKLKIFTGKIKYLEVEYARHSAAAAAYQKKSALTKKAAPLPAKAVSAKKAPAAPKKSAAAQQTALRVPLRAAPRPPMPMVPSRPVSQQFGVETVVAVQPAPKLKKMAPVQALKKPVVAAKKIPVKKAPVKPKGPTLEERWGRWTKNTSENFSRESGRFSGYVQNQARQLAKNTETGIQNTAAGFQIFRRDLSAQGQYVLELWSQRLNGFKNKLSAIQIVPPPAPKPTPAPVQAVTTPAPKPAPLSLKPISYAPASAAASAQAEIALPSFENQLVDFFSPREEAQLLPEPIQAPTQPAELPIVTPAEEEVQEPEPAPTAAPAAKKGLLGSDWLEMDETYKTLHLLSLMGRLVNYDIIAWKSQGFYAGAIDKAIANNPSLQNESLYHIFLDQVAQSEPETQPAIQEIRSRS